MFPDGLGHRSPQDMIRYAEILVYIAAADGELVREEIAVIEALMGRCMIHPEARIDIRNGFEQPIPLEQSLSDLEKDLARYVLRDAALVSAIDGSYDKAEILAMKKIAKVAGVNKEQLSALLDWVTEGWTWYQRFSETLE
ncbi:MAG: TerB family tellurite resistance protein [Candidatus Poseidonia sp.]|nr:TerB family tellurite resistance protein [Poseidonia sp.]